MTSLLGHTMATPHLDITRALDLFARLGLDGAELIMQDGYQCGLAEGDREMARKAHAHARSLGLTIGCLTPYIGGLNSPDRSERNRDIARYVDCVNTAVLLESPRIRLFSGFVPKEDPFTYNERWRWLTESVAELAGIASKAGVALVIENHFDTMTANAEETARLAKEIDSPGLGALYDQANLSIIGAEGPDEAIDLQGPWIRHVHVKDFVFASSSRPIAGGPKLRHRDDAVRPVLSRVIGDGSLDWAHIVARLRGVGYDTTFSFEYEYRSRPQDLPEPEAGLALSATRMRRFLDAAGKF